MRGRIRKKVLIIILVISMVISHLPISILVANATSPERLVERENISLDQSSVEDEHDHSDDGSLNVGLVESIEMDSEVDYEASSTALIVDDVIELESISSCNVIAEGKFKNQAGVNGLEGASWKLCEGGVLGVGAGFIERSEEGERSPWHVHRSQINRIVFTGLITAGRSLSHLFSYLTYVIQIEGLTYFDTSQVEDMSFMFHAMR